MHALFRRALPVVLLGFTVAGCGQSGPSASPRVAIGATAPEIQGIDADGKTFTLSAYRGKVVMLDFWGNW